MATEIWQTLYIIIIRYPLWSVLSYYCWNMDFDSWRALVAFARHKLAILPAWLLSLSLSLFSFFLSFFLSFSLYLPLSTPSPFPSCSSAGLILIQGNSFCSTKSTKLLDTLTLLVGTSLLGKGRNVLES